MLSQVKLDSSTVKPLSRHLQTRKDLPWYNIILVISSMSIHFRTADIYNQSHLRPASVEPVSRKSFSVRTSIELFKVSMCHGLNLKTNDVQRLKAVSALQIQRTKTNVCKYVCFTSRHSKADLV